MVAQLSRPKLYVVYDNYANKVVSLPCTKKEADDVIVVLKEFDGEE